MLRDGELDGITLLLSTLLSAALEAEAGLTDFTPKGFRFFPFFTLSLSGQIYWRCRQNCTDFMFMSVPSQ